MRFIIRNSLRDYFLRLSLNQKLVAMMLLLSTSLLTVYFFLYFQTEKAMYREFESQTVELSKAIQVGVEEVTSTGATDEKRLQDYLKKLNTKGVKEISIISTSSDKIISSTDPRKIGKDPATKRKELIFKAELGETVPGEGHAYNVIIPVVAGEKHFGYIHLTINTDDFSTFMRKRLFARLFAVIFVFGIGMLLTVYLARSYTKPIEEVVRVAQSVASGNLNHELNADRKDEIGKLAQSFNFMVERLREQRDLEEKLRKAEHLAGIGQFATSIAHEIKNPLNFISLSIDLIREKYRPADNATQQKFESMIVNIKKEIQRVSRFAESFLEFGRPLELNRVMTDMDKLIDEVIDLVTAKAQMEDIEIRKSCESLPELSIDPEFIKTCLYNIILNSFQAMPAGGLLTVTTSQRGSSFLCVIEDTGIGIPGDRIAKVFDPFFTTKTTGLGLGLALTKRVIEEHKGSVEIKSAEGRGTTFTITLPLEREA
ncbi:MAG: HAMP domain-containing protein [Nitrospirae bacterium]|nr:HAMP domain-containing protein [Nitrospirota bacterium]